MKHFIGIDLGGTNIATGVVNEKFEIISKAQTKTLSSRPDSEIAEDMAKTALEAVEKAGLTLADIDSVGIGTPGIANNKTGIIEYSNNLGFVNTPMRDYIKKYIDKPVYIENDANTAAFGEYLAGAAKGVQNAVCITLGTGVGSGIIIDGKIYSGSNNGGAEIGHTVIDIGGPPCTCGRTGCFEVFCSATGLIRMAREAMETEREDSGKNSLLWAISKERDGKISARNIYDAMREKDKLAAGVVSKYEYCLAIGIANVINVFQPDILCIGGGICNEGDNLLLPLRERVKKEVYTKNSEKNTEIVIAKLGNDAGLIGAALLGLEESPIGQ